jgi:hypothetical protein
MVIFVGWCMGLARTLQIILNRFCSAAQSKAGVLGESPATTTSSSEHMYVFCFRCTAPKKDNLDPDMASINRSRQHTETLVCCLNTAELWYGYGIVGSGVVGHQLYPRYSAIIKCYTQPFTNEFPRADIHELLSPDLLHQLIKGTFKDHLVTWVTQYIKRHYPLARAKEVLDEIDWRSVLASCLDLLAYKLIRIALAPPFSGLRRFPQGRGFKQWTGNDSKALMKVDQRILCKILSTDYCGYRSICQQSRILFLTKW